MERSAPALKEIYQPTPAPETLQQIQMSPFNWAGLADRFRFCQPAALEEGSETKSGRKGKTGRSRAALSASRAVSPPVKLLLSQHQEMDP